MNQMKSNKICWFLIKYKTLKKININNDKHHKRLKHKIMID